MGVREKSAHVSAAPPAAARINYYALGTHLLLLYMAFAVTDRRSYIAKLFPINYYSFSPKKKLSVEKFTSPRRHKGKTWTLTCYQASEKFTSPRPYKGKTLTLNFYQASEKFTSPSRMLMMKMHEQVTDEARVDCW